MSVDNKVPAIRFKGFCEKWIEKEFSAIATRVSLHYQNTGLPCVEYEDIIAGEGRFNKDIHQKKIFKTGLKFEINDVLFGKLRPYLKNWFLAEFEGLAVGDFWVLRTNNLASTFLFYLIQTNKFEFISNISAGSKMPRSDWGLVSSSYFFVSQNISESNEIGNYFQKLDTLINQHQQKRDQLSNIKKAMLEKMFPKQGETVPEIRFKGFSEEWEEKELKEICDYLTSSLTVNDVKTKGMYELYDANKCIGYTDEYSQPTDYITIIKDGAGVGRVRLLPKKSSFIATMGAIKPEGSDLYFLYCCLLKVNFIKHISGGTIPHIYFRDYGKEIFRIPSFEEQTAIGNFFQKLDTLINQHQQQITKLNNIKQACLSKMFV